MTEMVSGFIKAADQAQSSIGGVLVHKNHSVVRMDLIEQRQPKGTSPMAVTTE
jgi:hypothetical protein